MIVQIQNISGGLSSVRNTLTANDPSVNRLDVDRSQRINAEMQQTSRVINLQIDMNQTVHSNLAQRSQTTTRIINQNVDITRI